MRRLVALVGLFILVGALAVGCGPKADSGAGGGGDAAASNDNDGVLDE